MSKQYLFKKPDCEYPCSLLKEEEEWGLRTVSLVDPPRRFWGENAGHEAVVEEGIDYRRTTPLPTPAQLLDALPDNDSWQSQSRRTLARLYSYFLLCEDPQRRLDVREVETLSHQVSLVTHVLQSETLNRVLIADEVGLGKTVEVGLLVKELLAQRPQLRVLYLAPARLVSNVRREFERLNLAFRQWTVADGDARLTDPKILASIHRAVHGENYDRILKTGPWDILIVDECHHLSAWSSEGTDPTQAYSLVRDLIDKQPTNSRLILMSGTPHQGHATRFENLLRLVRGKDEPIDHLAGRVIYRTKEDIQDWEGNPVFPNRQVNEPLIVDLGIAHRQWINSIHDFYRPPNSASQYSDARRRAAGWRCAQALQWAASSPHAGLGYLVRQAVRAGWSMKEQYLREALATLRPYRLGASDEDLDKLYARIDKEVERQKQDADVDDIEDYVPGELADSASKLELERLLIEGINVVKSSGDEKWIRIHHELLSGIGQEKVVLFAQPIETVTALARFLENKTGRRPALIIGGQSDTEREQEVASFWQPDGPQFLVSSRAGGEGINLQVARRLIHIDVPWNPMEMEQRVGRIHRFGSRETVVIDTVVVKDSREADAYATARQKLFLIASTLVEKQRFESVFARVMCLLPQDELIDILITGHASPLSVTDQQRIAELVQRGFQSWKSFHDRFGEQQRSIKQQNAGLAAWDDIVHYLRQYAGAEIVPGYRRQHFVRQGKNVRTVQEDAAVLALNGGDAYVCADYSDSLVYGPSGQITPKLGLNLPPIAELLRKHAFPDIPSGAAYLRWPTSTDAFPSDQLPIGVIVLLRQMLQMDRRGGWLEVGSSIHVFKVMPESAEEVVGETKGRILRGLFRSTLRKSAENVPSLINQLQKSEPELVEILRRPTADELTRQIRHAVTPLVAAVICS